MAASPLTSVWTSAVLASHRPAGARHRGLARVATTLAGSVVSVIAICGLAWAADPNPVPTLTRAGPNNSVAQAVAGESIAPSAIVPQTPIYPGGSGDVTIAVTNHARVAVQVSAGILPSATAFAAGFRDRTDTTSATGSTAHNSGVTWRGSTNASGSVHRLATPESVAAGRARLMTITDAGGLRGIVLRDAVADRSLGNAYDRAGGTYSVRRRLELNSPVTMPVAATSCRMPTTRTVSAAGILS